jgi:hypothetical protein
MLDSFVITSQVNIETINASAEAELQSARNWSLLQGFPGVQTGIGEPSPARNCRT